MKLDIQAFLSSAQCDHEIETEEKITKFVESLPQFVRVPMFLRAICASDSIGREFIIAAMKHLGVTSLTVNEYDLLQASAAEMEIYRDWRGDITLRLKPHETNATKQADSADDAIER